MSHPLDHVRKQIDKVDHQLIQLLNQRAELVREVGQIKKKGGLDVYVPVREEQLLRKLSELNKASAGMLTDKAIRAIYREIMSAALALEDSLSIAFLSPKGSWTHQAAIHKFGDSVAYHAEDSIESIFDSVQKEKADYAVLPIEHTADGAVKHIFEYLSKSGLFIYAVISWRVRYVVMSAVESGRIQELYAHPEMMESCRSWLQEHYSKVRLMAVGSSTEAAELAQTNASRGAAALGTPLSAELHQLRVIEIAPEHAVTQSRYMVLGKRCGASSGDDSTMLMIEAENEVGTLLKILQIFADRAIEVRQIENQRTINEAGGVMVFYMEVKGHYDDILLKDVLGILEEKKFKVRLLGSYPTPRWSEER
jgi:chorismate mutase/prephenate dehydratase